MQNSHETQEVDNRSLRERLTYPLPRIVEIYPYEEWFDGSVWLLKMYEDFWVNPRSMQSAVYQAARKRKVKVKTHIPKTGDSIYVQAIGK